MNEIVREIRYFFCDVLEFVCFLVFTFGPGIMLVVTAISWHYKADWAWIPLLTAGIIFLAEKFFNDWFGF